MQQTGRCITAGNFSAFVIASSVVPMVNDLLIFCAITYRLMKMAEVQNPTPKKKVNGCSFGAPPARFFEDNTPGRPSLFSVSEMPPS